MRSMFAKGSDGSPALAAAAAAAGCLSLGADAIKQASPRRQHHLQITYLQHWVLAIKGMCAYMLLCSPLPEAGHVGTEHISFDGCILG